MPVTKQTKPGKSAPGWAGRLAWILLCVLLGALWIAGGASRPDALGQVVVRTVAAAVLIVAILFGTRPPLERAKPVVLFFAAILLLVALQLVPLPPGLWQALPGRAAFAEAAAASGQPQPWRPLSIVPGSTRNALASLIVPLAALLLTLGLPSRDRARLPGLLLGVVAAAALFGLLQASGAGFDNPLVNEPAGHVSGPFANRNHFALLLALGCLRVPAWMFVDGRRAGWRGPLGFGLLLLFLLTILATGSRAGMVLGALALVLGLALSRRGIQRELGRLPKWAFPALIAGLAAVIALFVAISLAADRAASINRAFEVDTGADIRSRGLPTVLEMIGTYFPAGSGFGGFDPMFRLAEPFALLKPTYFNHAHDDWLELALDGGLPAMLLMLAAVLWWARSSLRAWRAGPDPRHALPKLGSAMLLLLMVASAFDYPLRTPLIMAMAIFAALWLSDARARGPGDRSPGDGD
jgi:O-antigen ligase